MIAGRVEGLRGNPYSAARRTSLQRRQSLKTGEMGTSYSRSGIMPKHVQQDLLQLVILFTIG